jgi:5-methylcytosine-specific restriction enzyme B
MMVEQSCIAIGWPEIGEISWVDGKKESIGKLNQILSQVYPNDPKTTGREASQLAQFVAGIKEGDIVLTADGMKILGVGKVTGGYEFAPDFEFPHQRRVEWLADDQWQLPIPEEGLQSTVRELGKHNENLLAIERHISSPSPSKIYKNDNPVVVKRAIRLSGILGNKGLDINDPSKKHEIQAWSGDFTGLHLISIMYAAFQRFAPDTDIGIDLSKEYRIAAGE